LTPNNSVDASGGSASRNLLGAAQGALIRAAASTSTSMLLPILATIIRLIMLIEYPYLRRYRVKPTRDWDKHSAKLWDIANLIEPVGMVLGFTNIGRIKPGLTSLAR
jgi:hypothetical protein